MLDAQMRQRPPDLGQLRARDFAAGLGRVKIVAAAVSIERAEQAVFADHFAQRSEGRSRSLLGDHNHRIDLARGVVQGDDQIYRRQAFDPDVPRPVLMQHHAAHRPPRPLLAVRRPLGRDPNQSGPLQMNLRHRVAELVAVALGQLLVEMLDREVGVLVPIKPEHPLQLHLRRPPRRRPASPVGEPGLAFRLVAIAPTLKRPKAHSQKLRRRLLANPPALPTIPNRRKTHLPYSLANARRVHQGPSMGPPKTRHFTSYELTSLHVLATTFGRSVAEGMSGA